MLCIDGQRLPLSEYRQCNWGLVPSHALVTSSARSSEERKRYQQFLTKAVRLYSSHPVVNTTVTDRRYEGFNRFDTNQNDDRYYNRAAQVQNNANIDQRFESGRLDSAFGQPDRSFGDNVLNDSVLYEKFDLFESKRYGGRLNLLVQDAARNFLAIREEDQSFTGYLGQAISPIIDIRQCPVNRMTLCVTSEPEWEKCIKMRVSNKHTYLSNICVFF